MAHTTSLFTLGVDLGSTSLRAFLWDPDTKKAIIIKNKPKKYVSTRFERGDFSTRAYPFDGGEVYLNECVDPTRDSVSLKYAFYLLANACDDILEQYLLVQPLLGQRRDPAFINRLRAGIKALFIRLRDHVLEACKDLRLIGNIALSVPSQWDYDFVAVYRGIVAEVFDFLDSSIFFITETEAIAHYLRQEEHLGRLVEHQPEFVGHDFLLFLDFGGHNMNSSLFHIRYCEDNMPSIYRADQSDGAGGGSEQWEYNVAELAAKWIYRVDGRILSPKDRQALLDDFNRRKGGLGPGQNDDLWFQGIGEDNTPWQIFLDQAKLTDCFDAALREPLLLAEAKISRLAQIKSAIPRVIVTGGTARHEGLQHRLQSLCRIHNVPDPIFTDELDVTYDSVKIAKGAAYAIAASLSVVDFMRRGAAIGLQRLERGTYGDGNPKGLWNNTASFLTSELRTKTVEVVATGKDEMKLVCDPFFEATTPGDEYLYFNRCYDMLYLGTPSRGRWWLTVTLVTEREGGYLFIERDYRSLNSNKRRHIDSTRIPVQYDGGSNCIFVGCKEEKPIDELLEQLTRYDDLVKAKSKRKEGSPTEVVSDVTHQRVKDSKALRKAGPRRRATKAVRNKPQEVHQPSMASSTPQLKQLRKSSTRRQAKSSLAGSHKHKIPKTSLQRSNTCDQDADDVPREFSETYSNLSAISRSALLAASAYGTDSAWRKDGLP